MKYPWPLDRVEHDTNGGCWLWPGTTVPGGYGQCRVSGRDILVHRLSWEAVNGPIPPGKIVRHKCDVSACFNPDHLLIGTQSDNVQDSIARGRHVPGKRKSPITGAQLSFIRDRLSEGWKDQRIADALGVARFTVCRRRNEMHSVPTEPVGPGCSGSAS